MYSFSSRVRYSEVDKNRKMDLYSLINYFQDCTTFHSEDVGKGIDYLRENKRIWLMNGWQIIVNRFPVFGEEITISTWPYDFKGMYGYRNFTITDTDGRTAAAANSIWVLVDAESYRPVKVMEDDVSGYITEARYDMEYAPRKINVPDNLKEAGAFPVIRSNIDTNNHVNNGQYIKMAEELLPAGFLIRQMRAEYRKSAVLGDIIIPKTYESDGIITVVLAGQDGIPYTIIEFKN